MVAVAPGVYLVEKTLRLSVGDVLVGNELASDCRLLADQGVVRQPSPGRLPKDKDKSTKVG
jgi:hypothetical protein